MGLEKTRNIHRIIIHKDNPDIVYVGAIGSSWGEHPERGVYKTTDGGKSWSKILYVNEKTGIGDLIVDPSNPNKLIAAMWEHRRKPWTFHSGGPGSGLYITVDGGENWKKITSKEGLPEGDLGRIGLAIATNKPEIIYALVESKKNALYKSEDGGDSWKMINNKDDIGNRPFYYSDIFVDPKNENRVYSIFSLVNISEDGGKSFRTLLPYFRVHPDHHAWYIHPENPDYIIDGNDGGLNISRDGGKTWRFAENIPVAQYYHINVDMEFPYNVYGGMQDNGSWAGPAYVLKSQGIRNSYWQEVMFGDGFDVVPDPDDSRYGYAMSQMGNVGRYDRLTGHAKTIRPTHPDANVNLRFNWNSAIAQDPFNNSIIYYGSQFVHKSTDKGNTWTVISPDLTTNNPEKQKQHISGGLTYDATGAENHCSILAITPSPVQKGLIWAGTDDGNVQLTKDGGKTWNKITIPGMPSESWVAQIKASTHNAGEAFVVVNNYRNFDFKPYLFKTSNFGQTWVNLVDESKVWGYTLSVVQDFEQPNLLFLGTEYGLYVSIDGGNAWTKWTNGYPTVSTMDLAIHPREGDLVIGTFGRAAYVMDDIRPLREIAAKGSKAINKKVHIYNPPEATITLNQQPEGSRFAADGIFQGENRPHGAMITYSINKPAKKETKENDTASEVKNKKSKKKTATPEPVVPPSSNDKSVKYDSIKLEIYNSRGEIIRTLYEKAPESNGLHRMYWGLDEKGSSRVSREEPRSRANYEPSGVTVLPGEYKLKIYFGDAIDSTLIKVRFDPRVSMSNEILLAQYNLLKKSEAYINTAAEATERLRNSLKILNDYEKSLKEKEGDTYKELLNKTKAIKDSVNVLFDEIIGKEPKGQGIIRDPEPSPVSYFYRLNYYIGSSLDMP
ncbi:MAG: hypothetical protein OEY34_05895, partial [Cyclobacteriaceae bacterium]|nr:hypothetical protein [Cyclobacteriaceae bacterium]